MLSRIIGMLGAGLLVLALTCPVVQAGKLEDVKAASAALRKATALIKKGKPRQALRYCKKAVALSRRALGSRHKTTKKLLVTLGTVYRTAGAAERDERLLRRSVNILETQLGKGHVEVAQSLNKLATLYRDQGRNTEAEPLFQRCLGIWEARRGRDHPDVAVALNNLATLYQDQGRYAAAEPLLRRSLQIREARRGPDHPEVATALNNLARLYQDQGRYAEAEPLYQHSLRIQETGRAPNLLAVATILSNLAGLYKDQGRFAAAEPLYQRSLRIREGRLGKDHPDVANSLNNLATLYENQGRYAEAEALFRRSLRLWENKLGKEHPTVATALGNLAVLYKEQGRYTEAEPLQRRSLKIRETRLGRDHPDVAIALSNLALLYENQGRYAEAEALYRRSLQIREARLGKDHPDVALSLNNLAGQYDNQRRYAEAEPLYRQCLRIWEAKLGQDHPLVATCLNNLGLLYDNQGRYAEAEPLYRRSLQIRKAQLGEDHPAVATCLNNLALLYRAQGRYAEAEPLYRRSLQIREAQLGKDHPAVAASLNNLLTFHGSKERWAEAADAADRARRLLRRHVQHVLPGLSESQQLTFLKIHDENTFHIALSLGLLRGRADPGLRVRSAGWVLNGKALTQQSLAERALLAHAGANLDGRKTARQLLDVRSRLAALRLSSFTVAEETRRRQQLEQLTRQEQQLAKSLALALGQAARQHPWIEVAEVRRALPRGGVLIDIVRFDVWNFRAKGKERRWQPPRYVAWVIPAQAEQDVQVVDLGPAATIDKAIQATRRALRQAPEQIRTRGEGAAEQELRQPLQALARLVLHPLLDHVGPAERWVISPDASLWLVPWAALPLPNGKYALEEHSIRYVVSGRDLVLAPVQGKAGRALVLADPDYDLRMRRGKESGGLRSVPLRGGLPQVKRLQGTADEARAITPSLTRYCQGKPRVYTGQQALEGVIKKAARPRVLVLSTHGFFLEDQDEAVAPLPAQDGDRGVALPARPRPTSKKARVLENPLLRCGLLLAGCNRGKETLKATGDDGVLTGLEIVGCDLRGCELVVLSACDTGVGEVRNGEGVAGLRQAFQLAGARSVLATLWQIPDRETARLMRDFFGKLAGGQGKAEALRAAQLALLKARRDRSRAAHPFFWAAFTLTGQ
jgi:CHAT domain-containing protein/Tfp pilus assembly protein PilF